MEPACRSSSTTTSGRQYIIQAFDSADDMRKAEAAFDAMDASETPGTRVSIDRGELKLDLKM